MCGVGGFISYTVRPQEELREKGRSLQSHLLSRGPDGTGCELLNYSGGSGVFVHTRLSVLDLSDHGNQPMNYQEYKLVFNGEIYNYKQIRAKLKEEGFQFFSDSDTEVLLKGFVHWGKDVLKYLEGMFSFGVYNDKTNELFLARDHFGIKPLYYSALADGFYFASNMRSIKKASNHPFHLNAQGLYQNFEFGSSLFPVTCIKEINILPAGHYLEVKDNRIILKRYYNIEHSKYTNESYYESPVNTYQKLLQQAVNSNLVSDVPVGILLSGGIDSTVLAKLAGNGHLDAYTLGMKEELENESSEAAMAKRIAQDENMKHTFYNLTSNDILSNIHELLTIYEEPVSFLEPHFFVGKMLRQKRRKIVLSGLGPDELLLGYHYHQQLKRYFNKIPTSNFFHALPSFGKRKIRKLKKVLSAKELFEAYRGLNGTVSGFFIEDIFPNVLLKENVQKNLFINEQLSFEKQLSQIELHQKIGNHHMLTADKFLMNFGVEGRFPYLNRELVEYQFHAPAHLKLNKEGKVLQRKLASNYLSKDFLQRPKTGFHTPLINREGAKQLKTLLLADIQSLRQKSFINNAVLDRVLNTPLKKNFSITIYLASLNRWLEEWNI